MTAESSRKKRDSLFFLANTKPVKIMDSGPPNFLFPSIRVLLPAVGTCAWLAMIAHSELQFSAGSQRNPSFLRNIRQSISGHHNKSVNGHILSEKYINLEWMCGCPLKSNLQILKIKIKKLQRWHLTGTTKL